MGTNYYLVTPDKQCEHCGSVNVAGDRIHIGKSSVGWHFSFQATEHKTPEAWKNAIEKCIAADGGWISTEDSESVHIEPAAFWGMVQARRDNQGCCSRVNLGGRVAHCIDGVDFCEYEFS